MPREILRRLPVAGLLVAMLILVGLGVSASTAQSRDYNFWDYPPAPHDNCRNEFELRNHHDFFGEKPEVVCVAVNGPRNELGGDAYVLTDWTTGGDRTGYLICWDSWEIPSGGGHWFVSYITQVGFPARIHQIVEQKAYVWYYGETEPWAGSINVAWSYAHCGSSRTYLPAILK
jgi:hypothetical protein